MPISAHGLGIVLGFQVSNKKIKDKVYIRFLFVLGSVSVPISDIVVGVTFFMIIVTITVKVIVVLVKRRREAQLYRFFAIIALLFLLHIYFCITIIKL